MDCKEDVVHLDKGANIGIRVTSMVLFLDFC